MLEGAFLHDFGSTELVTPVHHGDMRRKPGEKQCLLHGRIPTAYHHHLFATKKEPVAGGAGRDTVAAQACFRGETQPACGGSCGDDQRFCVYDGVTNAETERPLGEVDVGHIVEIQFSPKAHSLFAEDLHHVRT